MSAVDTSQYALPPQALPAPPPTQQIPMTPPVGFPPPVAPGSNAPSAADAARKRKDTKKDEATKVGRKVLNATQGQGPTPPANPLATALPPPPVQKAAVEGAPIDPTTGKPMAAPQERNVNFTPAQYKPPNKGLEYAALALTLLFPGAPIGRAAAGFVQGLNKGSEQAYQRKEQEAEQKYKVDQANASNEYKNAVAKYGVASDEAKRAFVNAQAQVGVDNATAEDKWKAQIADIKRRQDLWQQGMDANGKPIPPPPAFAKPLPPGAPAGAYGARENALAEWYGQRGMTGPAQTHATNASEYEKQVDEQRKFVQQMQLTDIRAANSERLTEIREAHSDARMLAVEQSRELATDARERDRYRTDANRAYSSAQSDLLKLTKPTQKIDPDTNQPVQGAYIPPRLDKPGVAAIQKQLANIRNEAAKGGDPSSYARYLSSQDGVTPEIGQVLNDYGTAFDLQMRSRGRVPPDLGEEYYAKILGKKPGANDTHPKMRNVNGVNYYLHKDGKYYPAPEGTPTSPNNATDVTNATLGI